MDIKKLYTDVFDEDRRLNHSHSSKVEFLSTMEVIGDYLHDSSEILEVGAGTGIYSLALAELGHKVTAVELVKKNLRTLESKMTDKMTLTPVLGNALDLSMFEDNRFDLVLNLGPLYHLPDEKDRIKAIKESMRVLKKGGHAFFAYINNDMVFITEALKYTPAFLLGDEKRFYDKESFKVVDEPFTVLSTDHVKAMFTSLGLEAIRHVATDGFAELLRTEIDGLTPEKFDAWFNFHRYLREKPEFLGASHHLLYVTEKR